MSNGHRAEVRLTLASAAQAEQVLGALSPENAAYVDARIEANVLVATATAAAPMSLLHTLDDLLACAAAAQKAASLGADNA